MRLQLFFCGFIMIASVDYLSDEEEYKLVQPPVPAVASDFPPSRATVKRKQVDTDLSLVESELRVRLRQLVQSTCACFRKRKDKWKGNCLVPFREAHMFDRLRNLRMTLNGMSKEDADKKEPK